MPSTITEVRMQHFRSFSDETVLRFRPGLNLLVGANGAGKSNVLDAVLFALTQELTAERRTAKFEFQNLFLTSLIELRRRAAQPTATRRSATCACR